MSLERVVVKGMLEKGGGLDRFPQTHFRNRTFPQPHFRNWTFPAKKNLSVRGVPWWVCGLAGLLMRWRPVRWPRWNGWLVYWPAGVWVGWVRRAQIHFRGRRFSGHLWFSQFANQCKAFFQNIGSLCSG